MALPETFRICGTDMAPTVTNPTSKVVQELLDRLTRTGNQRLAITTDVDKAEEIRRALENSKKHDVDLTKTGENVDRRYVPSIQR
jgi:hypothetical protein